MNISVSIRKLLMTFIAFFMALSVGLVYWQVIAAQQVTANPHNIRRCLTDSAPIRGRIFDRNGILLADSTQVGGCGYIRHYTDSSLAALIGYYAPGFASTGLEAKYDNYLSGRMGLTSVDNTLNQFLHKPPIGDDIYLTIDERIQKIVNQHFDDPIPLDGVNTFPTDRGSVIVTDPHTGEILAMLSRPGYDPNKMVTLLAKGNTSYYDQLNANKEQPLIERPLQGLYAPGSTYKTVTLLAGLDAGKTTLHEQFTQQQALGPLTYNGQPIVGDNIRGYTFHYPVTTEYGYTHSDNIIFAQVGVHTGASAWLNYNTRFYVGQKIPFDLPVATSSVLKNGNTNLQANELAADAFGQGYDFVSPMQMSLIDNIAANNGQLMQPLIVSKIVDPNKTPILTNTPQTLGAQQVSSQAAAAVRQAMYGVVRCGSGSLQVVKMAGSPWNIIGKTGTAEVGSGKPAHSWLITQAPYSLNNPAQLPALTIVAMKENGGEGGASVGPMITSMYNDIFASVIKVPQPTPPDPNYCFSSGLLQ